MRNYKDLSRATNIAMGSGVFAFINMKIGSFNIVRKSMDGVDGNFSNKGIGASFISFYMYTRKRLSAKVVLVRSVFRRSLYLVMCS